MGSGGCFADGLPQDDVPWLLMDGCAGDLWADILAAAVPPDPGETVALINIGANKGAAPRIHHACVCSVGCSSALRSFT